MKIFFKLVLVPYKAKKLKAGMIYHWDNYLGEKPDSVAVLDENALNNSAVQEEVPDMLVAPYLISEKESIVISPEQIGIVDGKEITIEQLQEIIYNDGYCKVKMEYKNDLAKSMGKIPTLLNEKVIIFL